MAVVEVEVMAVAVAVGGRGGGGGGGAGGGGGGDGRYGASRAGQYFFVRRSYQFHEVRTWRISIREEVPGGEVMGFGVCWLVEVLIGTKLTRCW